MNFINKLKGQQEIFLSNVSYNMSLAVNKTLETHLVINDGLDVSLENAKIKVIFSREVKTEPVELFALNVAVGCLLPIKDEFSKINWDICELNQSIKEDRRILSGLISRASLLISQITASYGQPPIITPPTFLKKKGEEDSKNSWKRI